MGDRSVVDAEDDMAAASKIDGADAPVHEGTPTSSVESTPEHDMQDASSEQPSQPQKRKGGRKPIYATSEERKQRNRQAQAAFRERRTEYIKQLEAAIEQNKEALGNLQQSHRSAADECLMLRYKNSLLERILLEKGIDVQAELQLKTGSALLPPPGYLPPGMNPPPSQPAQPPLQRTAVERQHARRSGGPTFLPKLAPGQPSQDGGYQNTSPQGHPTPSSHASSPTNVSTRSPMAMHQGGMTPPTSSMLAQGQGQQYQPYGRSSQQPNPGYYQIPHQPSPEFPRANQQVPPSRYQGSMSSQSNGSHQSGNAPPQMAAGHGGLEQEYDTQESHTMLDHADQDTVTDAHSNASPHQLHAAYPPQDHFDQQQAGAGSGADYYQRPGYGPGQHQRMGSQSQYGPSQIGPQQRQQQQQQQGSSAAAAAGQGPFAGGAQAIDPNDPMLDADPFGLSASMHYPTAYTPMDQRR
ncbi:hypothetical protein D0869_14515 [Hortaea werneckii]|uniref:BZIP domain-containing protein n=1 Tax=Hortaea werneckii TaxID=91943 RepID=A0A3M6X496_HORWE|nr:hypothetical protein D0869_14515 [Hortaea werneckii]RMX85541.1 hypothetical protein D0868_15311 [Hortaea werneckii]